MIAAIAIVAEERIRAAMKNGDFQNLPGQGLPLDLAQDANIPPELRMAHKLLKNGGYLDGRELKDVPATASDLLAGAPGERGTYRKMLKLKVMEARVRQSSGRGLDLERAGAYYEKIVDRVAIANKETIPCPRADSQASP